MELYIFLYCALLVYTYWSVQSAPVLYITIFIIAFFVGFRGEDVGADTLAYKEMYDDIGWYGYGGYPEPLYGLACEYLYKIGLNFHFAQFVIAFVALFVTAKAIQKRSPNYGLSVFCLLLFYSICYSMNIYRQMIACYIAVYVSSLFGENTKKRFLKFFLGVLLAMGFHTTAIILFLLPIVERMKFTPQVINMSFILSFLIGILDIPTSFLYLLGDYAGHLAVNELYRSGVRLLLGVLLALYWMIGYTYLYIKSSKEFTDSIYMKSFFIGVIINNLLIRHDQGLRMLLYFSMPMIIGLPIFVEQYVDKKIWERTKIILYLSIHFFVLLLSNSATIIPYVIAL